MTGPGVRAGEASPLLAGALLATLALTGPAAGTLSPELASLLATLLCWPLAEECLFRGALQGALARRPALAVRRCGVSGAVVLTALAFAAAHAPAHGLAHAAAVFAPGVVFGVLRERTGGLAAPIAAHGLANGLWLLADGGLQTAMGMASGQS
jgi:membrane protease YdiL (CAAX protease family)